MCKVWGMRKDKSAVFCCTHLFSKCRWSPIHFAVCACEGVKRGAGRKGSEKKGVERWKGRDGRGRKGGGGDLVISPEGDNGKGAHCNGCHVVPSLHN